MRGIRIRFVVGGLALAAIAVAPVALAFGVEPGGGGSSSVRSRVAPVALEAYPASIALTDARDRAQLAITARGANGELWDVSDVARYETEPAGLIAVSARGVATPIRDGSGTIKATWGEGSEAVSVTLPFESRASGAPRAAGYRHEVSAVLSKAGCNMGACHGNFNGKGGFRLSLRGQDPEYDHAAMTREASGRRIDLADPDRALLLRKPTGQTDHEGGVRLTAGGPEYRVLRDWMASGARDDVGEAAALSELTVYPSERYVAAPGSSQQLVAIARFADGTTRDVTRFAAFDVDDPTKSEVDADGRVTRTGPGEVVVAARYLGGRALSRLAFLADRPNYRWEGPAEARGPIDAAVFAKLRALRMNPSPFVDDATFLRRAHLDAIGRLPTPEETRAFLADEDPGKRERLVDALLARPEFADHWALKWADLLRNEEKTMGEKGVRVFQRWLRDKIDADAPLTELASELVSGVGSTWSNPGAAFHRTNRDPETAAETVAQVFLGVRLQCARCHNHPFDVWTQEDYYGLAGHFANVKRKEIDNQRRDGLDKHEITGDVLIYLEGRPGMPHPRTGRRLPPKPPGGPALEVAADRAGAGAGGGGSGASDATDALGPLADWLASDNRMFARNMANRIWFHLTGRGVVDPVDDFRDSNPPSNPALLDALTEAFVADGSRLKPLARRIMTSDVYRLDARPNETNAEDEANFARASARPLAAEALLDALSDATGAPTVWKGGAPEGTRAVQLPGVARDSDFLRAFGKPERLLTCECERSEAVTLAQAFQMISGDTARELIERPDNRIGRLLASGASDPEILEELTLAALCRYPTDEESAVLLGHVARKTAESSGDGGPDPGARRRAWEDAAWALVNSKGFLFRN